MNLQTLESFRLDITSQYEQMLGDNDLFPDRYVKSVLQFKERQVALQVWCPKSYDELGIPSKERVKLGPPFHISFQELTHPTTAVLDKLTEHAKLIINLHKLL